ncbi:hypothetical protein CKO29_18350, partial [Allochromatium vinosum]|nr:hypothetical protein [Allochromatium vinosum]
LAGGARQQQLFVATHLSRGECAARLGIVDLGACGGWRWMSAIGSQSGNCSAKWTRSISTRGHGRAEAIGVARLDRADAEQRRMERTRLDRR